MVFHLDSGEETMFDAVNRIIKADGPNNPTPTPA